MKKNKEKEEAKKKVRFYETKVRRTKIDLTSYKELLVVWQEELVKIVLEDD